MGSLYWTCQSIAESGSSSQSTASSQTYRSLSVMDVRADRLRVTPGMRSVPLVLTLVYRSCRDCPEGLHALTVTFKFPGKLWTTRSIASRMMQVPERVSAVASIEQSTSSSALAIFTSLSAASFLHMPATNDPVQKVVGSPTQPR